MAEYEIVGFDGVNTLEAPQGADTYVAKKAVNFEQAIVTVTVNGRNITNDGNKLDLITVTAPVNLDDVLTAISQIGNAVVIKGYWDPATNVFPTSTLAGESWIISAAGTVDGVDFNIGDRILALVDGASTIVYATQWLHLDYTDQVTAVNGEVGNVSLTIEDIPGYTDYLKIAGIDSLAKLNALVLDATLTDIADQATAAQGALAATALQPEDIDSLTKLNALVIDATLIDTTDSRLTDSRTPVPHTHVRTDITDLLIRPVKSIAAATYDVVDGDEILHVTYTTTGAVTSLTLMSDQVTLGRILIIKDAGGNATANNITIDTEGSETIDGAATKLINTDYDVVRLYCDGTNWFIW